MLDIFKSIPTVHLRYREETLPARARDYARDTITLGWEERQKSRGRRQSDRGMEFAAAFSRGTVLQAGDCVLLEDHRLVVAVVEALEPVFVIEPADPPEWARIAYHIGNSHQPMMTTATELVCPDVPGMDHVLAYHAISFVRTRRPFTPIGHAGRIYQAAHQHRP